MSNDTNGVDYENNFNRLILNCLNLPLGDVRAASLIYFEQCVIGLGDKPLIAAVVNGNPVYADPDSGIILVAVCGAAGVAVRLPAYFTGKLLGAGAKDFLVYQGGRKSLSASLSGSTDAWIVTDGTQNLADIRRGLSAVRALLAGEHAIQQARKAAAKTVDIDRPENDALRTYLKTLNATIGTPAPDVLGFVFNTLPQLAQIKVVRKTVENILTMAHPDSGIIFAFYINEYLHVRLPESQHAALLQEVSITGNRQVFTVPEAGAAWIRFGAFSIKEKSPSILAQAYQYAAPK